MSDGDSAQGAQKETKGSSDESGEEEEEEEEEEPKAKKRSKPQTNTNVAKKKKQVRYLHVHVHVPYSGKFWRELDLVSLLNFSDWQILIWRISGHMPLSTI